LREVDCHQEAHSQDLIEAAERHFQLQIDREAP
jgi:hypothetical protein